MLTRKSIINLNYRIQWGNNFSINLSDGRFFACSSFFGRSLFLVAAALAEKKLNCCKKKSFFWQNPDRGKKSQVREIAEKATT